MTNIILVNMEVCREAVANALDDIYLLEIVKARAGEKEIEVELDEL